MELLKREQFWQDQLHPKFNKNKAYRTMEQKKEYQKQYRENNLMRLKQYRSEKGKQKKLCHICNCSVNQYTFKRHLNSIKHKTNANYKKQKHKKIISIYLLIQGQIHQTYTTPQLSVIHSYSHFAFVQHHIHHLLLHRLY